MLEAEVPIPVGEAMVDRVTLRMGEEDRWEEWGSEREAQQTTTVQRAAGFRV